MYPTSSATDLQETGGIGIVDGGGGWCVLLRREETIGMKSKMMLSIQSHMNRAKTVLDNASRRSE